MYLVSMVGTVRMSECDSGEREGCIGTMRGLRFWKNLSYPAFAAAV